MTDDRLAVLLIVASDDEAYAFRESLAEQAAACSIEVGHSAAEAFGILETMSRSGAMSPLFDAVAIELSCCERPPLSLLAELVEIVPGAPIVAVVPHDQNGVRIEAMQAGADVVVIASQGFGTNLASVVKLTVEKSRLRAEIERQRHQLLELASRDELTDLANRRRFNETIDLEVERANRYHRPITLVLFDLDSLKTVNDTHGHPTGDAAIRHIGACLRTEIRRFEVAARVGGDEFAVLLVDTNFDAGRIVAEKLRKRIADVPIPPAGTVTVSAGVASLPAHAITSSDLVRVADEALYEAKNAGRNRVVVSRSLRQERDGERHPVRFKIVVAGKDSAGRDFTEETETELISRRGARVVSRHSPRVGERLTLRTPFHGRPLSATVTSCYRGADNKLRFGFKLLDPPRWGG